LISHSETTDMFAFRLCSRTDW